MFLQDENDIAQYLARKGGFFIGYSKPSDEEYGNIDTRNMYDVLGLITYAIEISGREAPYKEVLVDTISMYINRLFIEKTYYEKTDLSKDEYRKALDKYISTIDIGLFHNEGITNAMLGK